MDKTRKPKRKDKALNPERSVNGVVRAVFGQRTYILWGNDIKSTPYITSQLLWWEEGSAWTIPSSKVTPSSNG